MAAAAAAAHCWRPPLNETVLEEVHERQGAIIGATHFIRFDDPVVRDFAPRDFLADVNKGRVQIVLPTHYSYYTTPTVSPLYAPSQPAGFLVSHAT